MSSIVDNAIFTLDCLETQILQGDVKCMMDVERLGADILHITYKEKEKNNTYLINIRGSIGQIWLSSPLSGPSHFFYQAGEWQTSLGIELSKILNSELTLLFGVDFKIDYKSQLT